MSGANELAIKGGRPVRDVKCRPWPTWPVVSEQEWVQRVEPALRSVYLSGVEGLPGPRAEVFGKRFAEYCGTKYARLVSHGTDAISAALAAALDLDGNRDGGEVILPNYTFIATASAPLDRRCTLAFVDIDLATFTIDPKAVEAAVVPGRTKAILPVHLTGHPANMAALMSIADRHGLAVIEDCAQSHGAKCDGRMTGSIGHAGAFSFQSSKNLTAGEGGAVTTDDPEVDARVEAFMDVGRLPARGRWEYPRFGWNFRPSEYLATLLTLRLEDLEAQTRHRERTASYLSQRLAQIPGVTPPRPAAWCTRHAYHLYSILIAPDEFGGRTRDDVVEALRAEGIPCMAGYTTPLSDVPAISQIRSRCPEAIRVLPCPNTENACRHAIWLAQQMMLADERDMDDIAEAFAKVQKAFGRK